MSEPPLEPPPAAEIPPELACWNCGAPHDRYQEYCLNCGRRLTRALAAPGGRAAWSRQIWTRENPLWLWAALAALLLVALIAGAIVAFAATDDDPKPRKRANPGTTSTLQELTDITTTPGLPPTLTVQPTTTFAPSTTTTTAATTTTRNTETPISWPSGRSGYTVVIESIPTSQGRSKAEARANEAIDKGVQEVGILNSSDYSSLKPGYYVVFAGVHDTEREAENALPAVRNAGYPVAYVREVSP